MLVELDVTVRYAIGIGIGNLRHNLTGLIHEVVLNEPLTYELLGELLLGLTLKELLLITVGIEVT